MEMGGRPEQEEVGGCLRETERVWWIVAGQRRAPVIGDGDCAELLAVKTVFEL